MCEGLVALLMDRADYHKFMMRSVARDLLASLVFRPIMQHMTPYNINKVLILATCLMQAHHVKVLCFGLAQAHSLCISAWLAGRLAMMHKGVPCPLCPSAEQMIFK